MKSLLTDQQIPFMSSHDPSFYNELARGLSMALPHGFHIYNNINIFGIPELCTFAIQISFPIQGLLYRTGCWIQAVLALLWLWLWSITSWNCLNSSIYKTNLCHHAQTAKVFVLSVSFFGSELFEQKVKNCNNKAAVDFNEYSRPPHTDTMHH